MGRLCSGGRLVPVLSPFAFPCSPHGSSFCVFVFSAELEDEGGCAIPGTASVGHAGRKTDKRKTGM